MSLTPAGPWGTGTWGVRPTVSGVGVWGGADGAGPLTFVSAVATSERTVRVVLSQNAAVASVLASGDALNPTTWTVEALDSTGAVARTFIVLALRAVDADFAFELYCLEKFDPATTTHRVRSSVLRAADGTLVAAPTFALFAGCRAATQPQDRVLVDLRNAPTDDASFGGTYRVGASGDYLNHSGDELLRKLVIRRLTTGPGAFFHLTDYGLGLAVKEPYTPPDLTSLKAEIERQVRQEPEVQAVAARVALAGTGVMTVEVRARVAGREATVQFKVPTTF